ncbi:putative Transcriptional regulatory protein LnrK [Frankia sp. AiPs1]|uniref:response regulator n=1 Tax=Frankia sp. AiPa1 TaxID=573492 RepID=UPI00202ACC4A|nr:response regulator transcription factor [Frankia sp. AiPa1]MCL9758683.1 response regulator transcription factor [Frankia sp. AiPa1]
MTTVPRDPPEPPQRGMGSAGGMGGAGGAGGPEDESAPRPGPRRPAVAVIDDDTVIREGLALLLPDVDVLLTARHLGEFEALVPRAGPVDVVLVDLSLTGLEADGVPQGRRAVRRLREQGWRCLIYTGERRLLVLAGCLAEGARGIVHKTESTRALRDAIGKVADGGFVLSPAVTGLADAVSQIGRLPTLTERQQQVLSGRARGEPFREIAERLYITRKTAEEHMSTVAAKFADYLRTHSPADLERELGLAPGDLMR